MAFVFNLQYRVAGETNWTTIQDARSPRQIMGLTSGTRYEFRVEKTEVGGQGRTRFSDVLAVTVGSGDVGGDITVVTYGDGGTFTGTVGGTRKTNSTEITTFPNNWETARVEYTDPATTNPIKLGIHKTTGQNVTYTLDTTKYPWLSGFSGNSNLFSFANSLFNISVLNSVSVTFTLTLLGNNRSQAYYFPAV